MYIDKAIASRELTCTTVQQRGNVVYSGTVSCHVTCVVRIKHTCTIILCTCIKCTS